MTSTLKSLRVAELHDGAAAVALLDVGEGVLEGLVLLRVAHLRATESAVASRSIVLLPACGLLPEIEQTVYDGRS